MNMHPYEHQQRLIHEGQASFASQRRMLQRLGSGLNWLGNQFVRWGEWLQTQQQTLEPQSN